MSDQLSVYLIRHAIAAERGDDWPDDTQRPLTPRGAARFRDAVAGLLAIGVAVDEILTSPLVRAYQTAELLAQGLPGHPPVISLPALAPGGSLASVIDEIVERADREALALIGHEPGIGELAAKLAGASVPFTFKKGGVCRVDFSRPVSVSEGHLCWFAPPRLLRRLGE